MDFQKRKNYHFATRSGNTISTGETVLNFVPITIWASSSRSSSSGERHVDSWF
jgi:hypothetical protein